jgi:hypothetical protein
MRLLSVLATLAALVVLGCGGGSTSPNGTSSAASHSGCLGQPDDDMPATINEIEMYDLQSKFIKGSGNMKVVVKRAKVSIARVKKLGVLKDPCVSAKAKAELAKNIGIIKCDMRVQPGHYCLTPNDG